jgi:endonuclease YncB( thermonuclease family)
MPRRLAALAKPVVRLFLQVAAASRRPLFSRCIIRGAALALLAASPVLADPCKAIPDKGPLPKFLSRGKLFAGPVAYVGDGDSLCVDVGSNSQPEKPTKIGPFSPGASWVEVRLADYYASELAEAGGAQAKAALVRIAKGRVVSCLADHRTYDRVAAVCRLQGVSLGDMMRAAGVREGGRGR